MDVSMTLAFHIPYNTDCSQLQFRRGRQQTFPPNVILQLPPPPSLFFLGGSFCGFFAWLFAIHAPSTVPSFSSVVVAKTVIGEKRSMAFHASVLVWIFDCFTTITSTEN